MDVGENPLDGKNAETAIEIATIALQAVPYVGSILSSTASFFLERRKNERLNKFLVSLADDLKTLEGKINTNFVSTEGFRDLTDDIFTKASETRQQEKLDALRSIFLNAVLANNPNYDAVEEITNLIYSWQARHIILIKILYAPHSANMQMGNIVGNSSGYTTSISTILSKLLPEWDNDQINRTWSDLYDKKIHRTPSINSMMTDKGIGQLEGRLTDFGIKIAKYLENPAQK